MNYVEKVRPIVIEEANKLNLEIESVEWVFENNVYILRIIADSSEGIDINQVTELNNAISERLDIVNFIEEEYMLEVSSPGIECELKNDEAISKNIGKYIHIDTKEKIAITKESFIDSIDGYLEEINEDNGKIDKLMVSINIKGRKKKLEINKNNIKFIRKAVKF